MVWSLSSKSQRLYGISKATLHTSLRRRPSSSLATKLPTIAEILRHDDGIISEHQALTVAGSIRTIRKQKRHAFAEVGDGSTTRSLQAILDPRKVEGLHTGTFVVLKGTWVPCPSGKEQTHELHVDTVEVLGPTNAEVSQIAAPDADNPTRVLLINIRERQTYPLQKKFHSNEFLRTIPHLRIRTGLNGILTRLRSDCEHAIGTYLRNQGFVRVQPPILTTSDCEGAGQVFRVSSNAARKIGSEVSGLIPSGDDFFRDAEYLTVSSQLHLEAYMHEFPKVWTLSPTFRAERSDTPRHVSEFWMLELELRTESLDPVMNAVEDLIRTTVKSLRQSDLYNQLCTIDRSADRVDQGNENGKANIIAQRWQGLMKSYWPRITYYQAIQLLTEAHQTPGHQFDHRPSWENGLRLEHERFIAHHIGQGSPVFVTDYPQRLKPFYMLPNTDERSTDTQNSTVACFDLVLPEMCEVAGGSLREHRLEQLLQAMGQKGQVDRNEEGDEDPRNHEHTAALTSKLDWYVDLRRYGSVPHGGFGLGFDRLLSYLCGVDDVKDVIPWPRSYGQCYG